jgi:NAD(P) transhydrogenase subunit beta
VTHEFLNLAYLATGVTFIVGLKMMTSPRTARMGNTIAAAGMLAAIIATLLSSHVVTYTWIVIGVVIGTGVGTAIALGVRMTAVPQMVSFFNGAGGLAAGVITLAHYITLGHGVATWGHALVAAPGVLIGLVSFMIAAGKLQEIIPGRPLVLPGIRLATALLLAAAAAVTAMLMYQPQAEWLLTAQACLALLLGVALVLPIGGADMPVVIAMLNSFTGLAAAMTGLLLANAGLIIAGALVGASGTILTLLMCQAMNRSLVNVLFGAFGAAPVAGKGGAAKVQRTARRYTAEDAAIVLAGASQVMIVPGYGMAVAQAQHAVKELSDLLQARGAKVLFAVHPVAGRMPGHMNVLLAEANIPYPQLLDLEQSQAELEQTDAALIIGANDVVNPAAMDDPSSPVYGMPILDVRKARTVMIIKRSLAAGFAGIDNELFYSDKTMMLFGDAKEMVSEIVAALKHS